MTLYTERYSLSQLLQHMQHLIITISGQ